jgi:hypothetical protein
MCFGNKSMNGGSLHALTGLEILNNSLSVYTSVMN